MSAKSPKPVEPRTYSNVILWGAFAAVSGAVGIWFILGVHRLCTPDALMALLSLCVRTGFYVTVGLWCEGHFLRPVGKTWWARRRGLALHGLWLTVMAITVGTAIDIGVFAFAGYHLTTALMILFADGLLGFGTAMEASGLPPGKVAMGVVAAMIGVAIAVHLADRSAQISQRWRFKIRRRSALKSAVIAIGLLGLLDLAGYSWRNPYLWELENRRVPLAFSIMRPDATLASFRVALAPPAPVTQIPSINPTPGNPRPDIYVLVIESLREDILDPAIMPNFARFAAQAETFEQTITTGNVTHYSWYGLLGARYPIYFDVAKRNPNLHGSLPLAILRQHGYRLHLMATPDTAYQQLESIVFGPSGHLLESKYHPSGSSPAEHDRQVVSHLTQQIKTTAPGGNFHLVALDSTHFDYSWPESFPPPFTPYAASTSLMTNYRKDQAARIATENRYKNSAAWIDLLIGQFLQALEATGRMDSSIVIITGDHGESFWEHGSGTHGCDLSPEQLNVAFAMRFPGHAPTRFKGIFSLLDVMPTVLARIGLPIPPGVALDGRAFTPASDGGLRQGYALTFQGWNERAFQPSLRFVLTDSTKRILFELDHHDPLACRRLAIKDVILNRSGSSLSERGDSGAYQKLLTELPQLMQRIPFLEFR